MIDVRIFHFVSSEKWLHLTHSRYSSKTRKLIFGS